MIRTLAILLWTALFFLLLAGIDQLLVRVPASHPAHVAVAGFYRDFRARLLDLALGERPAAAKARPAPSPPSTAAGAKAPPRPAPASVEAVIDRRPAGGTPDQRPPRYVYADDRGEIQFAATLAEIPERYRDKAKVLGE